MHQSSETEAFLANLASSSFSSANASNVRQRNTAKQPEASTSKPKPEAAKKRDFTPEQAQIVKRIRACQRTVGPFCCQVTPSNVLRQAYYEILTIEKSCSDAEIKKAYRKHSLSVRSFRSICQIRLNTRTGPSR
jgi:DnaJ family protein B protein 12